MERIIEDAGDPVIRGKFDVSLGGNFLLYLREPCAPADISDKFFLHLIPADQDDLPDNRQQYEFDNLDFNFAEGRRNSRGQVHRAGFIAGLSHHPNPHRPVYSRIGAGGLEGGNFGGGIGKARHQPP